MRLEKREKGIKAKKKVTNKKLLEIKDSEKAHQAYSNERVQTEKHK